MRLTANFHSHEFRCRCGCGQEKMNPDLIDVLQMIRDKVDEPIQVTSGVRCAEHNKTVPGAAAKSWHVPRPSNIGTEDQGYAADITYSRGLGPGAILRLYVLADQLGAKGLGLYHNRIHVDMRTGRRARWIDKSWSWSRS